MPLGRLYVAPQMVNSGSPSPLTPSPMASNGISDLRAKWENNQNNTSHSSNNGFRKIEIKVERKEDSFNNHRKDTMNNFSSIPPKVNGTTEPKSMPIIEEPCEKDIVIENSKNTPSSIPIANGITDSNNNLETKYVDEAPKVINIPIRIEVSNSDTNNNCQEDEISNEIIEAPEGFREDNGTMEEVCNGNDVNGYSDDTVQNEVMDISLDNHQQQELQKEQPSEKITTIATDSPTTCAPPPSQLGKGTSSSRTGLPTSAKGLKNLGNTCYMNSIIQCLVHTRALLEFLQEYLASNQPSINRDTQNTPMPSYKAKDGKKITMSLARLAQDMWKGSSPYGNNHGVSEPTGFRSQMTTFAPKFGGFDQHDSQEFLLYALDGLHTELNRIVKKPKNEKSQEEIETDSVIENITYDDIEEEGIGAEEKSRRCWVFYLNKDSSVITDNFLGQFRSTLRCSECQHESVTFEPFWIVSLPLSKDTETISECFELFVKAETLDGDEMPTCEQCKTRRKCIKWYSFERWPEVLVVHLKRFAPSGSYRAKLTSIIQTPVSYLDLRQFSSRSFMDETAVYECYGVSNHSGTLHGGHYTATCRHPYDHNNWHVYNDRCVSGTNADHVVSAEAYLLFFHKKRPDD